MARLYIFEGIDERKQLSKAEKLSEAGMNVQVHYHKAWETQDEGMTKIECNEQCTLYLGEGGVLESG